MLDQFLQQIPFLRLNGGLRDMSRRGLVSLLNKFLQQIPFAAVNGVIQHALFRAIVRLLPKGKHNVPHSLFRRQRADDRRFLLVQRLGVFLQPFFVAFIHGLAGNPHQKPLLARVSVSLLLRLCLPLEDPIIHKGQKRISLPRLGLSHIPNQRLCQGVASLFPGKGE